MKNYTITIASVMTLIVPQENRETRESRVATASELHVGTRGDHAALYVGRRGFQALQWRAPKSEQAGTGRPTTRRARGGVSVVAYLATLCILRYPRQEHEQFTAG